MKRTFQPNNRKKSKKMGFLTRVKNKIVSNRRRKGRKVLAR
ncbi:MAG: bL34 family ribosomal protein [Bacilli bacterium]